jgi:glucosamine--fructose-6-phosphate aminotransferase (isomerizing)
MTKMLEETLQTKDVLKKQWSQNSKIRVQISDQIKKMNPFCFATFARGSSDHAAAYLNYLISLELKKLSMSLGPSLVSVHKVDLDFSKAIGVAISQSGKSPDILSLVKLVNNQKSMSLAFVNDISSPLAKEASHVYPLCAGEETSVAATKSFIASLYASASLIAHVAENSELLKAIEKAPDYLPKQLNCHWPKIVDMLTDCKQMMIVGRGLGFTIAHEAALKLKETCHIQAESFSSAEIKHGPQAVVGADYPVIIFALRGVEQESLIETGLNLRKRGARVCIISDAYISDEDCIYTPNCHLYMDPLNLIYSFYLMVEQLSQARGLDPDNPRFLSKVTLTI